MLNLLCGFNVAADKLYTALLTNGQLGGGISD
jgi:hypothetical protein